MADLYIGMMSGTSMDAVDATLVSFNQNLPSIVQSHQIPIPHRLKSNIIALCEASPNEIQQLCQLEHQLGHLYAQCVTELLKNTSIQASAIRAIGNHGQTIRHEPNNTFPYTLQIGDANIIAEKTGITTVADFRRRDIAAGGQGAPLVPAFHKMLFSTPDENRVIVNIGGMANITVLSQSSEVIGFDTGPGNVLLDLWSHQHLHKAFDDGGVWASSGETDQALLKACLHEPFFTLPPPKSTGRELFNERWLKQKIQAVCRPLQPKNVQATLSQLTATTIYQAIKTLAVDTDRVLVCGGGAYNKTLMKQLTLQLSPIAVETTDYLGVPPQAVESMAFAWLAKQTIEQKPGNLPSVTGASRPVILGAIYSA